LYIWRDAPLSAEGLASATFGGERGTGSFLLSFGFGGHVNLLRG
jgi:hypothetical protein